MPCLTVEENSTTVSSKTEFCCKKSFNLVVLEIQILSFSETQVMKSFCVGQIIILDPGLLSLWFHRAIVLPLEINGK